MDKSKAQCIKQTNPLMQYAHRERIQCAGSLECGLTRLDSTWLGMTLARILIQTDVNFSECKHHIPAAFLSITRVQKHNIQTRNRCAFTGPKIDCDVFIECTHHRHHIHVLFIWFVHFVDCDAISRPFCFSISAFTYMYLVYILKSDRA